MRESLSSWRPRSDSNRRSLEDGSLAVAGDNAGGEHQPDSDGFNCSPSLARSLVLGTVDRVPPKERKGGVAARFWSKVNLNGPINTHRPELGPCWLWTGSVERTGYGAFWLDGRKACAHIVAFQLAGHAVPDDCELDHLCRTRDCVRFDHLEPVTHAENMRRSPLVLKHGRFAAVAMAARKRVPLTPEQFAAREMERSRKRQERYRERYAADPEAFRAKAREAMRIYRARRKAATR